MTIYFGDGSSQSAAGLAGAGKVLQVVTTYSNSIWSTTSTSFTDTGFHCAITPSSSSSKVLVMLSAAGGAPSSGYAALYRGSTIISAGTANQPGLSGGYSGGGGGSGCHWGKYYVDRCTCCYLDSPGVASSTTYKLYWKADSGTIYLNRCSYDSESYQIRSGSSFTLMEVSG